MSSLTEMVARVYDTLTVSGRGHFAFMYIKCYYRPAFLTEKGCTLYYYQRPNLARDVIILCFSLGAALFLFHVMPEQGVFAALGAVAFTGYTMVALYCVISIIRFKELRRRYRLQCVREAELSILKDELLELLDTLELDESKQESVRYKLGPDRLQLSITKSKYDYFCRLSTDEFASYDMDTSAETRIKKVWTYSIPRQQKTTAWLEFEKSEVVRGPRLVQPPQIPKPPTLRDFIQHLFARKESNEQEATASDLHQLYQHIRYATTV
jgi:hypothetical protein